MVRDTQGKVLIYIPEVVSTLGTVYRILLYKT